MNDFNKLNYGRGYKIQAYYAGADTIQRCGPVWSYEQFSLLFFVRFGKDYLYKDVLGSADWSKLAIVVANINANFFMPVFFSDHLVIETAVVHLGHKSFTLLQRAVTTDTHEVKCECRTVMVGYDLATKEPKLISEDYKEAICRYEEKTLEELSKG